MAVAAAAGDQTAGPGGGGSMILHLGQDTEGDAGGGVVEMSRIGHRVNHHMALAAMNGGGDAVGSGEVSLVGSDPGRGGGAVTTCIDPAPAGGNGRRRNVGEGCQLLAMALETAIHGGSGPPGCRRVLTMAVGGGAAVVVAAPRQIDLFPAESAVVPGVGVVPGSGESPVDGAVQVTGGVAAAGVATGAG